MYSPDVIAELLVIHCQQEYFDILTNLFYNLKLLFEFSLNWQNLPQTYTLSVPLHTAVYRICIFTTNDHASNNETFSVHLNLISSHLRKKLIFPLLTIFYMHFIKSYPVKRKWLSSSSFECSKTTLIASNLIKQILRDSKVFFLKIYCSKHVLLYPINASAR